MLSFTAVQLHHILVGVTFTFLDPRKTRITDSVSFVLIPPLLGFADDIVATT